MYLVDGSPTQIDYMEDNRIKYKIIGENKGIFRIYEAITLVSGDYIGLFAHDDLLPAFSLYEVVKEINKNPDANFYTQMKINWKLN